MINVKHEGKLLATTIWQCMISKLYIIFFKFILREKKNRKKWAKVETETSSKEIVASRNMKKCSPSQKINKTQMKVKYGI